MRKTTEEALGNKLRVARAERAISQEELAHAVGVTRQTISSIETGQYCPSALLAFRLARALDWPIELLFWIQGEGDEPGKG
jgi:putative transcriptional regulator